VQLRHALAEYYPSALEAFEDWGSVNTWMFVQRFPTPQALKAAGKRQWEKFLHSRHLWRTESGPRRMELFAHATDSTSFAGVVLNRSAIERLDIKGCELAPVIRWLHVDMRLSDWPVSAL